MRNCSKKLLPGLLLLFCSIMLTAQPSSAPHYQVKAVFLYNFIQFVEWPATAFADANAPFIIGILGDDVLGVFLDDLVKKEKVNGHPIVIKYFKDPAEIKSCHILFINAKEANKAEFAPAALASRGILTVSDAEAFASKGGIIGFFNENSRIRFNINLGAAKEANLRFSSKLLRLAQIIESKNS